MLDRAGEIQNNVASLGPEAKYLRFEVSSGRLEWSRWNKPETRVVSEYCRRWRVSRELVFIDVIGLGDTSSPDSTATVITPSDSEVVNDLSVDLKGTSKLDGSIGAHSLNLYVCDEAHAQSVRLEGQDVIIHARGNGRINLAGVKAHQVLFMIDGGATVEVEEAHCNLILVRHYGDGMLRLKKASADMNDGQTVVAAVGNLAAIEVPRNVLMVPESAAQKFWDDLVKPETK